MTIAEELAKKQREVSVAEFFERNRHLLGFDNKKKALLTVVKEAVDNSLDACEEARILPEISVEIIDMSNDRFRIVVEDNGPGIVKKQIPNIFAKLLYGSKFHSFKQARGQQGIGISAAVLYAQLTTGRPARITSKISKAHPAEYVELHLDTQKNAPEIVKEEQVQWNKEHGTKIEMDISATYVKGDQSVDTYLKETAIVNPHATIVYTNPKAEQFVFPRATDKLPKQAVEIKPHPEGVELGRMQKMLKITECRTLQSFLTQEFSRVGPNTAKEICQNSSLLPQQKPCELQLADIERLMEGIKKTKIMAPPTDCVVPIGEELLEKGLKKEVPAEFYVSVSRSPAVYRGTPFVIETALAYGGSQPADQPINILRFANRVPLLYQQSACASFKSVIGTNWKPYGLQQSQGASPIGPMTLAVHLASVWPPFTSEAKEAIAHYPEIVKEIKLALQECGRKLGLYVNRKRRAQEEQERINIFEVYIPEVASTIAELSGEKKEKLAESLQKMLAKNKEFIAKSKGESVKKELPEKNAPEEQISLRKFAESDEND
ncbi:MAG: DNA topoisomerase VI subunit B [Candidatus Aenigmarchaeota archaeon]|nr:DNA topoisomerase VI subunit B [Candidatus Aenigmarchaeota archaeon]